MHHQGEKSSEEEEEIARQNQAEKEGWEKAYVEAAKRIYWRGDSSKGSLPKVSSLNSSKSPNNMDKKCVLNQVMVNVCSDQIM